MKWKRKKLKAEERKVSIPQMLWQKVENNMPCNKGHCKTPIFLISILEAPSVAYHLIKINGPIPSSPSDSMAVSDNVTIRQGVSIIVKLALFRPHVLCGDSNSIPDSSSVYHSSRRIKEEHEDLSFLLTHESYVEIGIGE